MIDAQKLQREEADLEADCVALTLLDSQPCRCPRVGTRYHSGCASVRRLFVLRSTPRADSETCSKLALPTSLIDFVCQASALGESYFVSGLVFFRYFTWSCLRIRTDEERSLFCSRSRSQVCSLLSFAAQLEGHRLPVITTEVCVQVAYASSTTLFW